MKTEKTEYENVKSKYIKDFHKHLTNPVLMKNAITAQVDEKYLADFLNESNKELDIEKFLSIKKNDDDDNSEVIKNEPRLHFVNNFFNENFSFNAKHIFYSIHMELANKIFEKVKNFENFLISEIDNLKSINPQEFNSFVICGFFEEKSGKHQLYGALNEKGKQEALLKLADWMVKKINTELLDTVATYMQNDNDQTVDFNNFVRTISKLLAPPKPNKENEKPNLTHFFLSKETANEERKVITPAIELTMGEYDVAKQLTCTIF